MEPLSQTQREAFVTLLYEFYDRHGRHDLPWRLDLDPYRILVSELMLQQTQVSRVIPKYQAFLQQFPTARSLAAASLGEVLVAWQGLGYNRRAKYLWQAAQVVVDGFPATLEELTALPGVGKNTAGAILAYVFNRPVLFIETNIRTVYLHHFFPGEQAVSDAQVSEILAQTLDQANPRQFYWALMDYGSHLKQTRGNNIANSKHYVKQSPFAGSKRQVRGAVIRALSQHGHRLDELASTVVDQRLPEVLAELQAEGLIAQTDGVYHLT